MTTLDEIREHVENITRLASIDEGEDQWKFYDLEPEVAQRVLEAIDEGAQKLDRKMAYCLQLGILIGRKQAS